MSSTWTVTCGPIHHEGTADTRYAAFTAGCDALRRAYDDLPCDATDPDGRTPAARLGIDDDEALSVRPARDPSGRVHPTQLTHTLTQLREAWVLNQLEDAPTITETTRTDRVPS